MALLEYVSCRLRDHTSVVIGTGGIHVTGNDKGKLFVGIVRCNALPTNSRVEGVRDYSSSASSFSLQM